MTFVERVNKGLGTQEPVTRVRIVPKPVDGADIFGAFIYPFTDVMAGVWLAGFGTHAYGFDLKYWPTVVGIIGVRWALYRRKL